MNSRLTKEGIHYVSGSKEVFAEGVRVNVEGISCHDERPTVRLSFSLVNKEGDPIMFLGRVALEVGSTATLLDIHEALNVQFQVGG